MNIDLDALRKDTQKHKEDKENQNSNNIYVQMPKDKGTLTLRLLPPAVSGMFGPEKGPFYYESRLHRVNDRNFHCPKDKAPEGSRKKLLGECVICSYLRWLWTESDKDDISKEESEKMKTLYSQLKINKRYYFNVVQRNVPQDDGSVKDVGPLILSVGITLYERIMFGICGDPDVPGDKGLGDVTDLKKGYDFMLIKGIKPGKDKWPDYAKSKFVDETTPLGEPEQVKEWLDGLHDLKGLRVVKTPQEMDHHLKCHLGLREDVAEGSNFDPSEYSAAVQNHSAENTATVTVTDTKPKPKASVPVPAEMLDDDDSEPDEPVSKSESKSLADDDFMAKLQGLGKK